MARAQMVKALQSMARNALYGERVSALLAKSPVWAEFQGQKHDLFISSAPTAGYLTGIIAELLLLVHGRHKWRLFL